jgi:DNA-binding CsgD family transcriptional regulator
MGREHDTHEHASRALELAAQTEAVSIRTVACAALGLLELGLSKPELARDQLEPLPESTRARLIDPGIVWWQSDWIEANIRLGEIERAEPALVQLEHQAHATARICAQAAAARCRGLLASQDQFESHFDRARSLHALTPTPFERARTELCLGERLRRAGERQRARAHLADALDTFAQLGAEPWAVRADVELTATGETRAANRRTRIEPLPQDLLTPQELQVALAVAHGATNKQAAVALFLSPKTIEFHLSHIYRKLDIRSRSQLTAAMLAPRPSTGATS